MLNVGIIGLGEGRSTMSAVLQSDKLHLKLACDRDAELCKKREAEFGFSQYTQDYNDLLNDKAIDIIAIYTPDHLHATHIKQALQHDKHVVCTKPFIDNLADAKELLELQAKTGKKSICGPELPLF